MAQISWTYTVTDSSTGSTLEDVNVWATSDYGGQTVLDSGQTNASGQVTFSIEENTEVFIWTSFSGYTADAQPDNETVTAVAGGAGTMTAIVAPVPDSVIQSITCRDLVSHALTECGVLAQGETATAEDADYAHKRLNHMLDSWQIQRRLLYRISIDRHTLTANQTSHTIGPSGDFVTDRPIRIVKANIVVTGFTPELHNPLNIVETAQEWARVTAPLLSASTPSHLYCDYGWPDATLYLFPYPSEAYDLELFTWKPMSHFTSLDHVVDLPHGYYEALMYSLAERLCTPFAVPPAIRGLISADAAKARYFLASHNVRAPQIETRDYGVPRSESL